PAMRATCASPRKLRNRAGSRSSQGRALYGSTLVGQSACSLYYEISILRADRLRCSQDAILALEGGASRPTTLHQSLGSQPSSNRYLTVSDMRHSLTLSPALSRSHAPASAGPGNRPLALKSACQPEISST